ncbi:MAG: phosphonate ABC transporter substrate-binding protein, partial [Alphaproteobacteria bacterium]
RVLHKSEWLGFPPIAGPAKPRSAQLEEAITQALLRMDKDPEGRAVLSMLRLDGFEQQGPSVFDAIAEKVALVKALG